MISISKIVRELWYIPVILILLVVVTIQYSIIGKYKYQSQACHIMIQAQNDAILQMKTEGEEKQIKLDKIMEESRKNNKINKKQIIEIQNEPIPNSCEEAIKWGIQKAQSL